MPDRGLESTTFGVSFRSEVESGSRMSTFQLAVAGANPNPKSNGLPLKAALLRILLEEYLGAQVNSYFICLSR